MVAAPNQSGEEEGGQEHDPITPLQRAARHIQLVAEPVHVEEWRGELVEHEGWRVVVYEGSLKNNGPVSMFMLNSALLLGGAGYTHEAEDADGQSADGMDPQAEAGYIEISGTGNKIPDEISSGECR